jgi:hypothetical protein
MPLAPSTAYYGEFPPTVKSLQPIEPLTAESALLEFLPTVSGSAACFDF